MNLKKSSLLLVDDELIVHDIIGQGLKPHGFEVTSATSGAEALELLGKSAPDLAILDYALPDMCGADLYHRLRALRPNLPMLFLTAHSNLTTAVSLMKHGACDYLTKPFRLDDLLDHIRTAMQSPVELAPPPAAKGQPAGSERPSNYLFGASPAMRAIGEQIQALARHPDASVLITGPTGTGKTAIARCLHELTWGRNAAPFVEIDCSTIPRELCESELFGHERGAFTGADRSKPGLFEAAASGTAFLDEIGELEPALQAKFLRVLEARQFKRVGGTNVRPMTARVIAATNRSLPQLVQSGQFREDLYFRLNVVELTMPPLRERPDEIQSLAVHFLQSFATRYDRAITGFTPAALSFLLAQPYPGNIRELRNLVERAVIRSEGETIDVTTLASGPTAFQPAQNPPAQLASTTPAVSVATPPRPAADSMNLEAMERASIMEALTQAKGNKSKAAAMVGLSRSAFLRRLLKHRLIPSDSDMPPTETVPASTCAATGSEVAPGAQSASKS
jgi:DNA-binding NtrC family response regulator